MFDKITRVETVLVADSKPKGSIVSNMISLAALAISLTGGVVSYLSYKSNQEGMTIVVSRDLHAGMELERNLSTAVAPFEESKYAFMARWKVDLINISLTATTPIINYSISNQDFKGFSTIIRSNIPTTDEQIRLIDKHGNPIVLPLSLKPGEVLNLVLVTPTAVVGSTTEAIPDPLPPTPPAGYRRMPAAAGSDAFGNKGEDNGDEFTGDADKPIREPCVSIRFETGRNNDFGGQAYWCRRVRFTDKTTGILHNIEQTGCTDDLNSTHFD